MSFLSQLLKKIYSQLLSSKKKCDSNGLYKGLTERKISKKLNISSSEAKKQKNKEI